MANRNKRFIRSCSNLILMSFWISIAIVPAYAQEKKAIRVLFIGDSTTYTNAMPTWVTKLGENLGSVPKIEVTDRTSPNTSLHDHLVSTGYWSALDAIRKGGWDIVVLQGWGREPLNDPDQFYMTTAKFAEEVRAIGAEPMFFQNIAPDGGYYEYAENPHWGGNSIEMQKLVSSAYAKAAGQAGARLARAGDARLWLLNNNPEIRLHSIDKVHPSVCGSYLMACIYVCLFTGKDPREATWIPPYFITEAEAKVLRAVACRFCANPEGNQ